MFGGLRLKQRQRGQSSVFVIIFLGVMLLSLISLYNAGKLTSEKMQLQNAADAAAYSVSVVEARDLNFMSYVNRAMVANEVAVGQMVSLVSWADFLTSFSVFLRFYDKTFFTGPTLGISTAILEPVLVTWDTVTNVIGSVVRTLGSVATKILHVMNKIFSIAQTGYHAVSVVFMLTTLDDVIQANAPPRYDKLGNKIADGAKLSDFGIISLIGHITSYGAIPGIQVPSLSFTKTYMPNRPADGAGFERFAAITQESRDPFTRERGKTKDLSAAIYGEDKLISGWALPLFPPIHFKETIDIVIASATISGDLEINLRRRGGAELRYVGVPKGKAGAKKKKSSGTGFRGDGFNWSAGDTAAIDLWLGLGIEFEALGIDVGSASVQLRDGAIDIDVNVAGIDIDFGPFPAPTDIPLGAGGAQAGAAAYSKAKLLQLTPDTLPLGALSREHYGGAPKSALTWLFPGVKGSPQGAAVKIASSLNNIAPTYRGLPMYTDTVSQVANPGFLAPYFLIGLVKDMDDYKATGPDYDSSQLDVLRTPHGAADNELAAIAKSEVYFSRPLDLNYFRRADGQGEIGSAFNPFWQARLVDTSWGDRVVSLLIQQKQQFTGIEAIFNISSPGDLLDLIL